MTEKPKKVVKSKTVLTAPNVRRLGAFLLDYLFQYIMFIVIIGLVSAAVNIQEAGINVLLSMYSGLVIASLVYNIIVPVYFFKGDRIGQTFGKKFAGLKVIKANGQAVDLKTMAIRSVFTLFVEGFVFLSTLYLLQVLALLGMPVNWTNYITPTYIAISSVSAIFMVLRPSRQMFHDFIANTIVILYDQNQVV